MAAFAHQVDNRPVLISLLQLELASACHVRVAERSAYYALPEGSRGIYVGGGGSVRIARLIGTSRMMEMMLTGRSYNAEEGHGLGLSHYVVDNGKGLDRAIELARRIASNTHLTNYAILNVLPRASGANPTAGYLMEALMAAIASTDAEAQSRLRDFLDKKGPRALPN